MLAKVRYPAFVVVFASLLFCTSATGAVRRDPRAGVQIDMSAPNIIYIEIDALRADHLSSYGYQRPTTPEIDRWIAQRRLRIEL